MSIDNPYLDEFLALGLGVDYYDLLTSRGGPGLLDGLMNAHRHRDRLTAEYAWAVPNAEAIEALVGIGLPILEIGAGTGYWGHLLRQSGVVCHLYDQHPPDPKSRNRYRHSKTWTEVLEGGPEKAADHPDAALFLCWPPYSEPMAAHSLESYQGDVVAYVGEWDGCTADEKFHEMLEAGFDEERCVEIPRYSGLHDRMWIYKRKGA